MRRISIALTLVFLVPSVAPAECVVPLYSRVHYSPYAFSYHNNGLVPGGITYSPYAFRSNNSGLVFEGVRYTPYAFNYRNSGLILDYYCCPIPYVVCSHSCSSGQVCSKDGCLPRWSNTRTNDTGASSRCHSPGRDAAGQSRTVASVASAQGEDPLTIIRKHLREQGFSDVAVNRILRVGDRLVSADFSVGGRNLLIKYWDPVQIESLSAKADDERKPTGTAESRTVDKYKKDWEAFAGKYQQDGGEIYVVAASERTEIIAALNACKSLHPDGVESSPEAVYARQ
ncbi:MAG: hypothetical protein JW955_23355 [Sedimentisphaerales bacterium]|nr:hypothetical protein [Sedimentisphaerales bacterium]